MRTEIAVIYTSNGQHLQGKSPAPAPGLLSSNVPLEVNRGAIEDQSKPAAKQTQRLRPTVDALARAQFAGSRTRSRGQRVPRAGWPASVALAKACSNFRVTSSTAL